ncbi:MAG: 50S ribosomal protein L4 [Candidatus Neomarinimicrobiota bacterium]|nr:MAG: 50S ribosomal protein L4 [Candidatus Neomarinimicrobiota bacterium]
MSMKFTIFKKDGLESSEKMVIKNPSFGIEPHDHAIYLAVKTEMTNARQGSHSTKTRAEVRGGGRKPFRQKGRGAARAGSRRSPIWVGGGRAFGPKPKNYNMKINKKVKLLARKSALSYRYREGAIKVIEELKFSDAKSRNIRDLLKGFGLENKRVTILASEVSRNLYLSCRNFYNVFVIEAEKASTYDLLDCEILLIEKAGLEKLNNRLLLDS